MASNLNLQVTTEGVASEEQLELLRAEGCQEIQGFFVSPPISPDSFVSRFLTSGRAQVPPGVLLSSG